MIRSVTRRHAVWALLALLGACLAPRDMTMPEAARPLIVGVNGTILNLPAAVMGISYREQLLATGGDGSYRWAVTSGALPRGLALSVDGAVYGTPLDTGTTQTTITVSSGVANASTAARIQIKPRLSILTERLIAGTVGRPYLTALTATSGGDTVRWALVDGSVPFGLQLSTNGILRGTPTSPAFTRVTIEASSDGQVATRSFMLEIRPDSSLTLLNGHTTHLFSDARRSRRLVLTIPESASERAVYVALSPDVPSDSLNEFGGATSAVLLRVSLMRGALRISDTIAGYQPSKLPTVTFTSPYQVAERPPADSVLICNDTCSYGILAYLDQDYAYYEDRNLPSTERPSRAWYEEVARYNAIMQPTLRRIWGVPSDVDGNRRINILLTSVIGPGGFMWVSPCVGPGPAAASASGCRRTPGQEWFYAGAMDVVIRSQGVRASAGFFAITQTTDAQEYINWTQGSRFPKAQLREGFWDFPMHNRHNYYRGGWDATLGNGISNMVRYIITKGVDTLPDGTNIGGYFQTDGWRFSCLSQLRTCRVHGDTYLTPGMFGYWLWQHFGDGIGDRFTRADFGDYFGDNWEYAVGLRGAQLFNMFYLSTVLDDTPLGRASGLEWPENPVPQKLPGVRSQMHELPLDSTGVYLAPYSGPQVVRISGVEPGKSYILDLEFLSPARTAVTIVKP